MERLKENRIKNRNLITLGDLVKHLKLEQLIIIKYEETKDKLLDKMKFDDYKFQLANVKVFKKINIIERGYRI